MGEGEKMEEQLISFETAKLAKEKGFNIWQEKGFVKVVETGKIISEYWTDSMSDLVELICFQPTQSFLQKWLREEHNIHIQITTDNGDDFDIYLNVINNLEGSPYWTCFYKTYEEALEDGLQEALKRLEQINI